MNGTRSCCFALCICKCKLSFHCKKTKLFFHISVPAQSAFHEHPAVAGVQDVGREEVAMGVVALRSRQNVLGRSGNFFGFLILIKFQLRLKKNGSNIWHFLDVVFIPIK